MSSIKRIIMGWDPGETTGVCVAEWNQLETSFKVIYSSLVTWPTRLPRIRELIEAYQPTNTVVESFRLYESKARDQIGNDFPSVQVIGIIEAYLYMTGLQLPTYQSASTISGRPPVQILPEHQGLLYLGTAAMMEHSNDAYKHMRYWIEHQRHLTPRTSFRKRVP